MKSSLQQLPLDPVGTSRCLQQSRACIDPCMFGCLPMCGIVAWRIAFLSYPCLTNDASSRARDRFGHVFEEIRGSVYHNLKQHTSMQRQDPQVSALDENTEGSSTASACDLPRSGSALLIPFNTHFTTFMPFDEFHCCKCRPRDLKQ